MELARLPEAMEEAETRKRTSKKIVEFQKEIKHLAETVFYPGREIESTDSPSSKEWFIGNISSFSLNCSKEEDEEDEEEEYERDDVMVLRFSYKVKVSGIKKSLYRLEQSGIQFSFWPVSNYIRMRSSSSHNDFEVDDTIQKIIQLQHQIFLQKKIKRGGSKTKPKEKKVFTMPCSYNECKGMLSTNFMCGICDKYTCKDCHEPLQDEHKCNPDTVANTKAIKKETRPCPRCNARIYKIEGCDQMWCTSCKTPFSWITGKIVPSGQRLHNPHAIEYLRQTGVAVRAPGDLVCGGVITREQLNQMTANMNNMKQFLLSFSESNPGKLEETFQNHLPENKSDFSQDIIKSILNNITHAWRIVDEVSRNKLRESREVAQAHRDFNEERVRYILNKMGKDEFTKKVTECTKNKNIQMEMSHIWELVSTFGIEMFNALYNASVCNNIVSVVLFITLALKKTHEFDALVKYANTQFAVVSVAHSISVPTIMIDVTTKLSLFKNEKFSQIALKMMMSEQ